MPIKLIAADLDDTLLRHDLTISAKTLDVINRARDRGILFTVATGRMPLSSRRFIEQLGISLPVIACQGAIIRHLGSGEILYRKVIESSLAAETVSKILADGLYCQIYIKDSIYTPDYKKWEKYCKPISHLEPVEADLLDVIGREPEGLEKIMVIGEEDLLHEVYLAYRRLFAGRIYLTISKPNFLEISNIEVNKGAALAFLAGKYGIAREEIMAIGDELNDLEMIKLAGIGVAMGNARQEVKEAANYVTLTNNEDGAALAIEEFALKD